MLKISVLDQSIARGPDLATQAFKETLEMAQLCEQWGYNRFWVSEHHAFQSVAGSSPEVLLAAIGAATNTIQLGSGGIMLPHYSAYKVAENFAVLSNLYPNRIEVGVGRAPGADMTTAVALATDGRPKFERFPELVEQLCDHLWNPSATPILSPRPPYRVPLWMLGSSPDSAILAARLGLPYNLGLFINPQADNRLIRHYKQRFEPSDFTRSPYAILTLPVCIADTESQARALQHTHDINYLRFITGQHNGIYMPPEEAAEYPVGPQEQAWLNSIQGSRAIGAPEQVQAKLKAMAQDFAADEIMAVCNTYHFEDRKKSFELLSQLDLG